MLLPKSILITGASSGIGEALALAYAKPGNLLALTGRNAQRLNEVKIRCENRGAVVLAEPIDVTDQEKMRQFIGSVDTATPLELVIANAGISGGSSGVEGIEAITRSTFAINVDGVWNTIFPSLERMRSRKRGQIALVSSLAGYRGLPSSPAYSASKSAIKSFGQGLRGALASENIEISIICPGFVDSRITDANDFFMPMKWPAEKAAHYIQIRLEHNHGIIAFPWPMVFAVWLFSILPQSWADVLNRLLPTKEKI